MEINNLLLKSYNTDLLKICKYQTKRDQNKYMSEEELRSEIINKLLFRKDTNFEGDYLAFKRWLCAVVANTYKNVKSKASTVRTHYSDESVHMNDKGSNKLLDNLMYNQLTNELKTVVNNVLNDKEIRLYNYYLNGFKLREIAEKENMPINTVKTAIFSLKKKIKKQINYKHYV